MRDSITEHQERQRQETLRFKMAEQVDALKYLEWFASRHGWPEEDLSQVAAMLGLDHTPSTLMEIPYFHRRGSVARLPRGG
jgi:hypothetical protein